MIVTLDAKRRLTVPASLAPAAPGDYFDAHFDAEEDALVFRRLACKEDWLAVPKACPVSCGSSSGAQRTGASWEAHRRSSAAAVTVRRKQTCAAAVEAHRGRLDPARGQGRCGVACGRTNAEYNGRFLLRVPAPVHQALALKARAAGKSLNAYCAEKLAVL